MQSFVSLLFWLDPCYLRAEISKSHLQLVATHLSNVETNSSSTITAVIGTLAYGKNIL